MSERRPHPLPEDHHNERWIQHQLILDAQDTSVRPHTLTQMHRLTDISLPSQWHQRALLGLDDDTKTPTPDTMTTSEEDVPFLAEQETPDITHSQRTDLQDAHQRLREAITPYIDLDRLRHLAALGNNLTEALRGHTEPPAEVLAILGMLGVLLRPVERMKIQKPTDIAEMLMIDMGYLDHEQMRVVCLDTKNQIQTIYLAYQGTLNSAPVRVGELYKEAIRLNSAAIILAHNHPSGDPTPSPQDVFVTRQAIEAGKLLDVECLDHLVIGQGRWVSLRERGVGFFVM